VESAEPGQEIKTGNDLESKRRAALGRMPQKSDVIACKSEATIVTIGKTMKLEKLHNSHQ
jgi:hypothetical protein